jgi:phosphoribosylaminoimidazole (AIR) synthetase
MFRTFNMGLGIVLVVARDQADDIARELADAILVGEVVRQTGEQRVIIE